ncbi:Uncharacterised protein [uncultured archaeon]|nr:Uncharacterised protein [uncultured archaeon]
MDEETNKRLDILVKRLQSTICVEYQKVGKPDRKRVTNYLVAISEINRAFDTNYSTNPKEYNITKLPAKEK